MADKDNGYTIAQAYIQIMPSMDKFGSAIKGDMNNEGEKAGSTFSDGFKSGLKAIGVAAAAAATAVSGVIAESVKGFAEYEQLIGGVEKLFGDMDFQGVVDNASKAFETAGLSANDYMETVTSFSASLISSLEGDTSKAVDYADMAIRDMSDNANVFGSNMGDIQNAYQGFAKQNYTMLDNLKLGYGGTKTEMERLVTDAEKLNSSFKATRDENGNLTLSFADVVEAIHIVQDNMNITGTTAKEASQTIEGSVNTMKAAWSNLVTGLGDSNADISALVEDFSGSLITVGDNVLPVIENALQGAAQALPELVSNLLPKVISTITDMLPDLIKAATELINSLINALPTIVNGLVEALPGLLENIFSSIGSIAGNLLPALAQSLVSVFANLPAMLAGMIGGIVEGVASLITGIGEAAAYQAEKSIPSDLADGYVGKIKSNFERSFYDGFLNLQGVIAKLIGDEDWSQTVADLKLASALEKKIIDDYNQAMIDLDEYSFENFQIESQAQVSTAMSLMGALEGLLDENGNVVGDLGVAQNYVDQINKMLGEDVISIDITPADWIVQIKEQYTDADGNVTDPDAVRQAVEDQLNLIFGNNGDPIDLLETTYNAVSQVLSGYTEQQAILDQASIKKNIESLLVQAGVPEVEAKAIANASVAQGAIDTWFNTGVSTGWDNSSFIDYLQQQGYLPADDAENPTYDALVEIVTEFALGNLTEEEFAAKVNELELDDSIKEQTINYYVNTAAFDEAIEKIQELTREKYLSGLVDVFADTTVQNTQNFTEAVNSARTAMGNLADENGNLKDSLPSGQFEALNADLNNATLTMNAHKEEAEKMYQQYYLLSGGQEKWKQSEEDFVDMMVAKNPEYQAYRETLDGLRETQANYASQLLSTKDNLGQLRAADREIVEAIAGSQLTFEGFGNSLGLTSEQLGSVTTAITTAFDQYGEKSYNAGLAIQDWAGKSAEGQAIAESLGISTNELGQMLWNLSQNLDLTADATSDMNEEVAGTPESINAAAEAAENAATDFGNAAGTIDESSEIIYTAVDEAATNAENRLQTSTAAEDVEHILDEVDTSVAGQKGTDVGDAAMDKLEGAIDDNQLDVVSAVEAVESGMETAIDPVKDAMGEAGTEGSSNLNSNVAAWNSTVSDTVDDMYALFELAFSTTLGPQMGLWGYNAGDRFNANLELQKTWIGETAQGIADAVESPVASLDWKMQGKGYMAGSSLISGLNSATQYIYDNMLTVGNNAMIGFNNGMVAMEQLVYDTASTIANNAVGVINNALQIGSPSRVLMQTGEFVGEGLAIGLMHSSEDVMTSAADMASGVVDTAQGMFRNIDAIAMGAVSTDSNDIAQAISAAGTDYSRTIQAFSQYEQTDMAGYMAQILTLLDALSHMQMVTDTGVLAGEMAPAMDAEFNAMRLRENRG